MRFCDPDCTVTRSWDLVSDWFALEMGAEFVQSTGATSSHDFSEMVPFEVIVEQLLLYVEDGGGEIQYCVEVRFGWR